MENAAIRVTLYNIIVVENKQCLEFKDALAKYNRIVRLMQVF